MSRALAALLALVAGCRAPTAGDSESSSTIVLAADGGALYLTSPDDDAVVAIDPASLEERWRVDVAGAPAQLAVVDDALVVTLSQASELAWVGLADRSVTRVAVPCGGTGAVVSDGDGGALVACPNDDRVLRVTRAGVDWELDAPGRPTALARRGRTLAVGASRAGTVSRFRLDDRALVDASPLVTAPGFAAIGVDGLALDPDDRVVASYVQVDRDSDRDRPPERGGYGRVVDDAPRIEPRVHAPFGARYARFDGGGRVLSGPSALALSAGRLWIAHRSTDDVVVLDPESGADGLLPRRVTFRVGRGPRGLALSSDGATAWVDVGFAASVARLELDDAMRGPEGPVVDATLERTRALGAARLSDAARRGRAHFDDADDTHLTPSGVVTCATCHPAGGEDGLTWFLHTAGIAPKLRRTPPAWGARAPLTPFHWDGEFDDPASLTLTTIRELMEGDALLIDTDAIAAWMAEAPIPPGRPPRDDADAARIARGAAVFAARGCEGCHAGALGADGALHSVAPPADDPVAEVALVSTPPLAGVRARPPYLHDGRAPTLASVFSDHADGEAHRVEPGDVDALVAYLETR